MLLAFAASKVPFYICGSLFAVWAVVLAGIGLTRPSFPYGARGQRGVMLISFTLMALVVGLAITTVR